jgi:primosomal protein N' (replication factor Y)
MTYLIRVIPITKTIGRDTLSYFSKKPLAIGSIVSVPLRNKQVSAIVTGSEDAVSIKSELKTLDFELKKISSTRAKGLFPEKILLAADETARLHAASAGAVLSEVVPQAILKQLIKKQSASKHDQSARASGVFILQADDPDRLSHYRSLVREDFARKTSVILCLPTIGDGERVFASIDKGINEYTFLLHGGLRGKKLEQQVRTILKEPHPVFIITTPHFLTIPRSDIGTIIIERENSRGYQTVGRPEIDMRCFAIAFAKAIGARLIFGDTLLRVETLWQREQGNYSDYTTPKFRSLSTVRSTIVPMRDAETKEHPELIVLGRELLSVIKETIHGGKNLFIFSARRGLYPQTICSDCGTVATCALCGTPVVIHDSLNGTIFICHRCGTRRNTDDLCKTCGGWRLKPLGIGIDRVEAEIKRLFNPKALFVIGRDRTRNHAQALEVAQKFGKTQGAILIGTEMALPYLSGQVSTTAIATIDPLLSIPDFRIEERIMQIILRIRSLAKESFILQTRHPENKVFDYAINGNLLNFYRDEINLRREFGYPPFSVLIKISLAGQKDRVVTLMKGLEIEFAGYEPVVFPSLSPDRKGNFLMHALIRRSKSGWPDQALLDKLRSLPPQYKISVNPEQLLN